MLLVSGSRVHHITIFTFGTLGNLTFITEIHAHLQGHTVDGSEILRSPVDMCIYVQYPIIHRVFLHPGWLFGTSEPSTVHLGFRKPDVN